MDMATVSDLSFVCPDGAICASQPDGGCDPIRWDTSCGPGLVCATDGTCGVSCGGGNVVCSAPMLCTVFGDVSHNCVPPCSMAGQVVYRPAPHNNCDARALLKEEPTGKCFVPCWYDECTLLGDNFCGEPMNLTTVKDRKRLYEAFQRIVQ